MFDFQGAYVGYPPSESRLVFTLSLFAKGGGLRPHLHIANEVHTSCDVEGIRNEL
jgi:hypothetical protein